MSYQIKGGEYANNTYKRVFRKNTIKKTDVAQILNVTPQHLNSALVRGTEVYIVHDGDKIIDSF